MRRTSVILWSTSALAAALIASPAAAQDTGPATPPDPTAEAQEGPADPEAGSAQTDDAVQTATGADQAAADEESIVVTGLRRSLQSARNIKRNSEQIVDAIVAEDIGKLPDVTVAETAARIPGIQVQRARGEADGQVLLRGLPDVTTTYNGRDIFTAETRAVALGDFPAGGIAAIEAFKTTSANQIEGGIAGLINVRARRPFDFSGFELSGGYRHAYAYQSRNWDPNGNLLISNRWETANGGEFGALVNFSFTQMRYLDSARWNTGVIANFQTTTGQNFVAPDLVGIFYGQGKRMRPSVNAALQWQPNDNLEFYVDGLWQGYRDRVQDRQFEHRLWGGAQFTNLVLRPGTTNQAQSVSVQPGPPSFSFQGATDRDTDTYQIAAGGRLDAGRLRLTADVARTTSKFKMSLLSFDSEPNSNYAFNVNFDVDEGPGGMVYDFPSFDGNNIANWRYLGFFDRDYVAAGDDWQFRVDANLDTGWTNIPDIDFGIRYTTRDAYQENGERYCATWMGNCGLHRGPTPLSAIPIDFEVFQGGFRGTDIHPPTTWIAPTYDSIRDNVETLREIAGFAAGAPPRSRIFTAHEKSLAGYAQLAYGFDLGSIPVEGNLGVRVVQTDIRVETAETDSNTYTDYLPHASARLRLTDQIQLRLSATQTRTRPTFFDLRPVIFGPLPACFGQTPVPPAQNCFRSGSGGNPDLQPINSNNYDVSLEYYFAPNGFASLALFRRDFEGFITNLTYRRDDPLFGPGRQEVTTPVNGGKGQMQGFEANAQSFFDFLPGALSGLGAQANLTYLDDEQEFPEGSNATFDEPGRIVNVSKWSYNLVAMYEKYNISARLTYNWRSKWITSYVQNPGGGFTGEFAEPTNRLDFSTSYTPMDKITLTFDVSNILGKPFRNFRRFNAAGDTYPRDVRYEESIYSLGIRARL